MVKLKRKGDFSQETAEKGGAMAHGFERLYCQGFVNLIATSAGTGGNVIVPKVRATLDPTSPPLCSAPRLSCAHDASIEW